MALPLESVPNVSEGRDPDTIAALAAAFGERARLLDVHTDPDHNRSVFTLVASDGELVALLERAEREQLTADQIKRSITSWVPDLDRT